MKQKNKKRLNNVLLTLALVGGLVHLLQPFGVNLLTFIPLGIEMWVQGLAGLATVWYVISQYM